MAQFWTDDYKRGDPILTIDSGTARIERLGSFHVPYGQRVRVRPIDGRFVDGDYHYQRDGGYNVFWAMPHMYDGRNPVIVEVTGTDSREDERAEISWHGRDYIQQYRQIVVGDQPGDKLAPNDRVNWVWVPANASLTVYRDGGYQGLSETLGEGYHDLPSIGWGGCVSSWKYTLDELEADGYPTLLTPIAGELRTIVASDTVRNTSPEDAEYQMSIQQTTSSEIRKNWKTSATVTAGLEAGFSMGAEVKASLSVALGAEYGEESADGKTTTFTSTLTAKIPAGQARAIVMKHKVGTATIPCKLPVRNKRTGKRFMIDDTIYADFSVDGETYIGRAV